MQKPMMGELVIIGLCHLRTPFSTYEQFLSGLWNGSNDRKSLWNGSQVFNLKSQQCGQPATHDGMLSYSPAMVIDEMVIRKISMRSFHHIITLIRN